MWSSLEIIDVQKWTERCIPPEMGKGCGYGDLIFWNDYRFYRTESMDRWKSSLHYSKLSFPSWNVLQILKMESIYTWRSSLHCITMKLRCCLLKCATDYLSRDFICLYIWTIVTQFVDFYLFIYLKNCWLWIFFSLNNLAISSFLNSQNIHFKRNKIKACINFSVLI